MATFCGSWRSLSFVGPRDAEDRAGVDAGVGELREADGAAGVGPERVVELIGDRSSLRQRSGLRAAVPSRRDPVAERSLGIFQHLARPTFVGALPITQAAQHADQLQR